MEDILLFKYHENVKVKLDGKDSGNTASVL